MTGTFYDEYSVIYSTSHVYICRKCLP